MKNFLAAADLPNICTVSGRPEPAAHLFSGVVGMVKLQSRLDPYLPYLDWLTFYRMAEMGRKYIIPYGLYRCEGYISANLARKTTGFDQEDLELLWQAILNMFENNRSAARGKMAVRELIVFKHDSELGCAPAWKLFDLVQVERTDKDDPAPARSYRDYRVTVDEASLPAGVTCRRMG